MKPNGIEGVSADYSMQDAPPTVILTSLFECPVCFEFITPPILQCQSGHLICSKCRPRLKTCPTCRGSLGNIRNLAMEKVASTVEFVCKFSSTGCLSLLKSSEKIQHEKQCDYRSYNCPYPGANCGWQGVLGDTVQHLYSSHKSITTLHGEDIMFVATDIDLPGSVDWVMMQTCFGHHFILILKKRGKDYSCREFHAVARMIGTKTQADAFTYHMELNHNKRRLCWQATPLSLQEEMSVCETVTFSFDIEMARLFADVGNLAINVSISMV